MTTSSKKKKITKDPRSTEIEIKRKQDLDTNRLALQPKFEIGYSPLGVCVTEHCNVTDTIDPAQGVGTPPVVPAQVTGLTATTIGDTQINTAWNASGAAGLLNYKVYRSTASGFIPAAGNLIASPVPNSYNNTGLGPGTTYYYKVSAVNNVGEGAASNQASATTTGTPVLPTEYIYWKFDMNSTNSGTCPGTSIAQSSNLVTLVSSAPTPKFGSGSLKFDNSGVFQAHVLPADPTAFDPNFSTGFSFSFWINIRDNANLSKARVIMTLKGSDNYCWIYLDNKRLSARVFRHSNGLTTHKSFPADVMAENIWYHIALTYTPSNNLTLYKDGIADLGDLASQSPTTGDYSTDYLALGGAILAISGTSVDTNTRFDGNIDEFRYFRDRVLTSTEINNLKNTNAL